MKTFILYFVLLPLWAVMLSTCSSSDKTEHKGNSEIASDGESTWSYQVCDKNENGFTYVYFMNYTPDTKYLYLDMGDGTWTQYLSSEFDALGYNRPGSYKATLIVYTNSGKKLQSTKIIDIK